LVEKGQPDEAVAILAAWAAIGPNDSAGQQLLADALRIDPSARIAQEAFERMEQIGGDHSNLEAALVRFTREEVERLEAEIRRPSFRRAQMGFNNNIKFQDRVFHVQTEDSGLDQPHIITHLFADGGHVIKSVRTDYAEHLDHPDRAGVVMRMMREQHRNMALDLRDGRLDETIDRLRARAAQEAEEQQDSAQESQNHPAPAPAANGSSPGPRDPASAPPATVVSRRSDPEPCEKARDSEAPARNRRPSRAPDGTKRGRSVAPKPRRSQPPQRKKLGRPSTLLAAKPSADSIFGAAPQESLDDVILGYVSHAKNDPDPHGRK
jgi:hypothetical protein